MLDGRRVATRKDGYTNAASLTDDDDNNTFK